MGQEGFGRDWLVQENESPAPCPSCHLRERCVVSTIPTHHLKQSQAFPRALKPLQRGHTVHPAGQSISRILIVRAGSAKTLLHWRGGQEVICSYHLPGDAMGLEGLHTRTPSTTFAALETTYLCEFNLDPIKPIISLYPELHRRITLHISRALAQNQQHLLEIAILSVGQRLASFLLELSNRFAERSYSTQVFRLPFSRQEIANYLGMRTETLSRLLASLRANGIIALKGREIRLLQPERLEKLSGS